MQSQWGNLLGGWAILPEWLTSHRGQLEGLMRGDIPERTAVEEVAARVVDPRDLIQMGPQGTAIIPIEGPLIKRAGFFAMLFGFTGTDMLTAAVKAAAVAEDVSSILLHVDSPGGHVAGIQALSEAVRLADTVKPVAVHIDDLGASAAYWASAHARRITASATSEVGSLGTLAVVPDLSGMAEQSGIKVHVVSTGAFKGMGVPGSVVTPEHLAEIQRRVDGINSFFMRAVQRGRGLTSAQLAEVADGRVWLARDAQRLGLIDGVMSFEAAVRSMPQVVKEGRGQALRAEFAQRRAALAIS